VEGADRGLLPPPSAQQSVALRDGQANVVERAKLKVCEPAAVERTMRRLEQAVKNLFTDAQTERAEGSEGIFDFVAGIGHFLALSSRIALNLALIYADIDNSQVMLYV
jgi:hypothetical protein